jgi:hypothetical protein
MAGFEHPDAVLWGALAVCAVLPWILRKVTVKAVRWALVGLLAADLLLMLATYLGFTTYHYMGPQLGFSQSGNPQSWLLLAAAVLVVLPMAVDVVLRKALKPWRTLVLIAAVLLVVAGPAVFNIVSLEAYLAGGGGFGPYEGDYAGEVTVWDDPAAWASSIRAAAASTLAFPAVVVGGLLVLRRRFAA